MLIQTLTDVIVSSLQSLWVEVFNWLPSLFGAVLIFVVGLIVAAGIGSLVEKLIGAFGSANLLRHLVRVSVMSARLHAVKFLSSAAWWVVMVFGGLASLVQLGIAVSIINTVITGLIAMMAIAGGFAFGLGGKDYAAHLMKQLQDELEHHE